jgi:hypothetical protein
MDAHLEDTGRLRGFGFVLTRPAGENRAFAAELRRRGAEVVSLAPFRVVPRKDRDVLALALRAAANADVVVFASTLAVRHAFAVVPDWLPRGRVIAQGPATAQALAAHGIRAELPESGYRSEEVLQHPWLNQARRVVRITGAGGRDWLVQRLRERGIDAADLPVYERIRLAAPHRCDGAAAIDRQQPRGPAGPAGAAWRSALAADGAAPAVCQQRATGGTGARHALRRGRGRGLGTQHRPDRRDRTAALIA